MGTIANGQSLLDQAYSNLGGVDGADRTYAMQPWVRTLRAQLAADLAAAAGATIALGAPRVVTNPYGGSPVPARFRVAGARVVFAGAVTENDTNNATLKVQWRNADGTSPQDAATLVTSSSGSGTVALGQAVEMAIAGIVGPTDGNLVLVVTKGGTGVTLPAGTAVEVDVIPVQ